MKQKKKEKNNNKLYIALEILLGITLFAGIFLFFYLREYQPSGADVYGHIYKARFLGDQIREGNFFPVFARDWYNGYQPFRYWPILCYYVMAFYYLLTGSAIYAYYLLFATVFVIGYIGFCLIANREKRYIFILIGIIYFFLPDNIRLMLGEGNLARVLMMGMLPLFFYFFTNLIEHKRSLIPTVVMVFLFTNIHVMLVAMCAIIFCLYGMWDGWKRGTWYLGPLAFVLGFLCAGIVLLPALLGDVVGGSDSSTSSDVADWSQSLLTSLSFTDRMPGETAGSFGLLFVGIAVLILIFGKRKKGAILALVFLLMTSSAFLPLVEKLPFWMLRYVQMCYVLICYEWGFLEFKKKGWIWLTFLMVFVDIMPSYPYFLQTEEPIEEGSLLEEAVDQTKSRLGVIDESGFKSYISYYAYEHGVDYAQGWGLQGAKTRSHIVHMTEAAKYGYYSYTFQDLLELGCDSVLFKKSILEEDFDIEEIKEAAAKYGYAYVEDTDAAILFHLEGVNGQFGVNISADNLAIGSSALYISYMYPSFVAGESDDLDDYSLEELKQYKKIYLSGFTYSDQQKFEELLTSLADAGTEVYIDAKSIPKNTYDIGCLFGIEIQDISLTKVSEWQYGDDTFSFDLPYKWVSQYLTSSSEDVTVENFVSDGLELGYFATYDENIHVIGMSLPYMLAEDHQAELQTLVEKMFAMTESDTDVSYEIVPLSITYEADGMTIEAEKDVCTNIAYQDNFVTDQNIGVKDDLVTVEAGITHIRYVYAYFKEGMIVTLIGIFATIFLWILLFKKKWDPLVPLRKLTDKLLEMN